jgi:nitrile hydratase
MLLGIPPAWYKSLAYRSRTVVDPRGVPPSSASQSRPT